MADSFANASGSDLKKANAANAALISASGGLGTISGKAANGNSEALLLKESRRQTAALEKLLAILAANTTNSQNSALVSQLIQAMQQAKARGKVLGVA